MPGLPPAGGVARGGGAGEARAPTATGTYWGRPVPGFGDPKAPADHRGSGARGARRQPHGADVHRGPLRRLPLRGRCTARASPTSPQRAPGRRPDADGRLHRRAPARCAPPDNKPLPEELARCAPVPGPGDGAAAARGCCSRWGPSAGTPRWRLLAARAVRCPRPGRAFGHGAEWPLPDGAGARGQLPRQPAEHADGAAHPGHVRRGDGTRPGVVGDAERGEDQGPRVMFP